MAWRPFRNAGLKMAALGLGSLLWFTVTGEQVERKLMDVPISYRNLPESLFITEQPGGVDVSVRGSDADISGIQDIRIIADLAGATSGPNMLALQPDQVEVPRGVEVMQIEPPTVIVWLEPSVEREVSINPSVAGQPAPGFQIGARSVEPATAPIVGPESRIQPTTTVVTERVSVDGATAPVTQEVSVVVGDAQLRLAAPMTATVTVDIRPLPTSRTFPALPVTLANLAVDLEVNAAPTVTVTVLGPTSLVESLERSQILPIVDLDGLGPGGHTLDVDVRLPQGVQIESVAPATVTVRVR